MKLKNKFYLLFFLSTVLVLGTVHMVSIYREKRALYRRLEERGLALSRTLSLASLNSFLTNSFSDLNFYIDEITKDDDIEYMIVTDPYGKVVLHTDHSQKAQMLYDPISIRATRAKEPIQQIYTAKNHRIYEVSSPVEFASVKWGTIRIGFNLDTFNQGLGKTIQFFLLLTLGVIASVSLIFLFIGDKITQPIEKLIEATQGISQGNFSTTIPVTSKDEMGKLSQAFNCMAETLKEEKDKLEGANRNSALYNKKLKRKIDDLSTLNKASKALRTSLPPEKKFNFILHIAMGISQAKRGSFFSCSGSEEALSLKAEKGPKLNLDLFSQFARKAIKSGKPVALINGREVKVDLNLSPGQEGSITTLAYPLRTRNTVWGVVVLDLPEKNSTLDELQMVSTFLEEANLIIENLFLMEIMLESRYMDSFNRLASIVLHDLRGTVAKLSLSVHNARKYYYDPEFRESLLATISNCVKRIQSLTEKISERPSSLEPKPYSINQILIEVVDELGLRKSRDIKLQKKYGNIPLLRLDVLYIKRAFRNMVVNALEAMSQGGTIEISSYLKSPGRLVYIEIRDTGVGMTQNFIDNHLFKPFVTTKEKGLGLALYSAQEIVRLHGGEIEVESRLGQGTMFRIKLPVCSRDFGKAMIRKRLGHYLLDMGVTGEEKLKEAMQIQATDKRKIGKILINIGYVTKREVARAIEKQKEAERRLLELLMRDRL